MCGMHYERKRRLGTTEIVVKTEDERFWDNVDNTAGPYGCWPWLGSHNQGRAMFGLKVDGQWCQRFATRLIYEKVVGQIPEGHDIHHDCYNGWCVNPRHLRPLDPHLNKVLGAGRTACKRGHDYNEQNTYLRANGSVQCRVCDYERRYGKPYPRAG
jgi:hypothetical protein